MIHAVEANNVARRQERALAGAVLNGAFLVDTSPVRAAATAEKIRKEQSEVR